LESVTLTRAVLPVLTTTMVSAPAAVLPLPLPVPPLTALPA